MKRIVVPAFAAAVFAASVPWMPSHAQGFPPSCVICCGTPQQPCCAGGRTSGSIACSISNNVCLTADPCGGGGSCFLAGTLVDTPGGAVAIEELQLGDKVIGRGDDGSLVVNEVTDLYKDLAVEYFVINDEILVTHNHPFSVGAGWVEAKDLRVGDSLVGSDGSTVVVTSMELVDHGVRVFNLTVSGNHTFFAGGVLVHNKTPNPDG